MSSTTHAQLGALVRERREALGLSMDQLATQARVSRSSIHRLEHGHQIKPTPSKLARVLTIVGLDADAVRATLDDDDYRNDVVEWMLRSDGASNLTSQLEAARPDMTPDLVALHPDGTVVQLRATGHLDEVADMLKRAGWFVTRPA